MDTTSHPCRRLLSMLLSVLAILSAGTEYGFADSSMTAAPAGLQPLDRNERSHGSYRSFDYTLEDPSKTTASEQPASHEQSDAARAAVPPFRMYVNEFIPDVAGGTKRIFSKDNLPLAIVGVGLTGLAFTVDHRVKKYFLDRKPLEHVEKIGDTIGAGYPEIGVSFALLGTGELINDKRLADTGVVSLEAYLIDGIATQTLKYAVGRKRPNGGNHMSFPSGHASITATMAASISEMYDWDLRLAIPLYLTATFVGASRFQANEHYASDVIAGITLGTLVGISVAKYHKEKDAKGRLQNISLSPVFDKDLRGCVLTLRFL
jgi:hypothetical protein